MNIDQIIECFNDLNPDVQLREWQLVSGEFYEGIGRFRRNIAFWDGKVFRGYTLKFGQWLETSAACADTGFTPLRRIGDKP